MKIICVLGTRPEVIKLAPVIKKLKTKYDVLVVSTGQHKEILDQTMEIFNITSDIDLTIMTENQTITGIISKSVEELSKIYIKENADLIIGQGDTTTAFSAALASYFNKVPFAHVEAGLRSFNYDNPWPEEMNRVLISKITKIHFCPTDSSKRNLQFEGITENVYVTGNTVIDSLLSIVPVKKESNIKTILCTIHRRENFGTPLENIISALLKIVSIHKNVEIKIPVHPNPNVKNEIYSKLKHERIKLCEPLDYYSFCEEMNNAYIILTDSGGVQEEAPALGKPVLVLRDFTERPEAVELGVVKLVGSNKDIIVDEVSNLLLDVKKYSLMAKGVSPYGDGKASEKILQIIQDYYNGK
jgi:UDP-N-acetylglucosamine 2-epimerase (non-hydrolysing)